MYVMIQLPVGPGQPTVLRQEATRATMSAHNTQFGSSTNNTVQVPGTAGQPQATVTGATPQRVPPSRGQISQPDESVEKCGNFLSKAIKLASTRSPRTLQNVKELIQRLIDDVVQPEKFTVRLAMELNDSPQLYLIPFLKKNLPQLRRSLILKEMTIEGVRLPSNTVPQQHALPSTIHNAAELVKLPSHWSPMSHEDFFSTVTVQLSSNEEEYKIVARRFLAGVGTSYGIIKIERVQNKTLYMQYTMHKHRMTSKNPGMQVERHLWHGTSQDAIFSINLYGFSRSYTGKNAAQFGEGSYFAVSPSYSAREKYSPPTDEGLRHMYQVAVLTGHYTGGAIGMRVPPPRDASTPHIKYDTVVDNLANPSLFVVFHDVQAYPEYLLTFKRN